MEVIEILGFYRKDTGKKGADELRKKAYAPAVLYNGEIHENLYVPMRLLRDVIYTQKVHFIDLNIEGTHHKCILKDVQFHPVSDMILHVDFYKLNDEKKVTMNIPVVLHGTALGVQKGGLLSVKARKVKITALPKDMPENIDIDITDLDLDKVIRVKDIPCGNFVINAMPGEPLVGVLAGRGSRKGPDQSAAKK